MYATATSKYSVRIQPAHINTIFKFFLAAFNARR